MLDAWLKDGDEQKSTEKKERNATPGTDHSYCMCNRQPSDYVPGSLCVGRTRTARIITSDCDIDAISGVAGAETEVFGIVSYSNPVMFMRRTPLPCRHII